MRISFTPNAVIVLFVIVGRCWHVNAALDHSVPEQPRDDRILQESEVDSACSNSCNNNVVSDLVASVVFDVDIQEGEEQQDDGEETGGVLGGLLGRLMNGFFKIFNRRQDDGPKYTVRTENIIPLLEESSSKFKSLAELIKQESVTEAALTTTPDAIQKLYTAAADNMMLVATVIDPIVENMRLQSTMDIRSISCDVTRVLTVIRDVTVPNIQLMGKLLYTKANDAQTKLTIDQYIDTSKITTTTSSNPSSALTTTSSRSDANTCSQFDTSSATSTTTTSRLFLEDLNAIGVLLTFLFADSIQVGPIGNIVSIILLILLFPISIVISIVVSILAILVVLFYALLGFPGGNDDDGLALALIIILVLIVIGSPILIILEILENIREFFTINPRNPTPSPSSSQASGAQQANEVKHHLLDVLDSPLDTIIQVFGNKNTLSDTTDDEEEEIDCEMSALKCKTESLNDILPF